MEIVEDAHSMAQWIAKALSSSGYSADLSSESLWEIERFFDEQVLNGQPRPGGLLDENFGPRMFAVGSYLGEVLRLGLGGAWEADDADPNSEINLRLVLKDGPVLWPIQRVMKRFSIGPAESVAAYGTAFGLNVGQRPTPRSR